MSMKNYASEISAATSDKFHYNQKIINLDTNSKEEISRFSSIYAVRLRAHTNELIAALTERPIHKRLRR
jgi:hypothetical protein